MALRFTILTGGRIRSGIRLVFMRVRRPGAVGIQPKFNLPGPFNLASGPGQFQALLRDFDGLGRLFVLGIKQSQVQIDVSEVWVKAQGLPIVFDGL